MKLKSKSGKMQKRKNVKNAKTQKHKDAKLFTIFVSIFAMEK